jgi:phenylacetate-coenzyme A ligase PaaK-like adenylate-forming protein
MSAHILDLPLDARPDPDEFVRAAMEWHFAPATGSAYWLRRARTLDFDPRADVKGVADLALFPNTVNDLRDAGVEDLIPRGYGPNPRVSGVYESGGTTGAPKRVVVLPDWLDRHVAWLSGALDRHGLPGAANWLAVLPSGPHIIGEVAGRLAAARGGIRFSIDLDPRWVKKLVAAGKAAEADGYAEHLVEQAGFVLRSQDVEVLITTPPLLERITRDDELADLIRTKIRGIVWGGAHMDDDSRHLYRTEVFPGVPLVGEYGSTMVLGAASERVGLTDDDPCIFDPPAPSILLNVVDPDTGRPVRYGERGQVVMHHLSRDMLLPNNLERDLATRIEPPAGVAGDSVADVLPVTSFDGETVIEGVY